MTSRPSTAAVLAAYQVLRPGDLVPPLKISDSHFEQLRAGLAAAYRVDYQTIDQVRLLRAIYLYRGAISLISANKLTPIEAVLQASAVLAEAERYTRHLPEEDPDGGSQLPLS